MKNHTQPNTLQILQAVHVANSAALESSDKYDWNCLHAVCALPPNSVNGTDVARVAKFLLSTNCSIGSQQDSLGRTPFHLLLENYNLPSLVQHYVDLNSDSLVKRDAHKRLPLHAFLPFLALNRNEESRAVLKILLSACPKASRVPAVIEPLTKECEEAYECGHILKPDALEIPLQTVLRLGLPVWVAEELLKANPGYFLAAVNFLESD